MSSRAPAARAVAADALVRIERDGAYANLALPAMLARSRLADRDRAFVTDLVYGTIRMRRACDHIIEPFVLRDPDDDVRALLRLGTYQLVFAGVAPHAAVGETVAAAPRRVRGFVNAVLRRVAAVAEGSPVWPDDATRLSYPDWIVERLTADLGPDDAVAALEWMNRPPTVTTRDDGYIQDVASTWVSETVEVSQGAVVLDVCAAPGGKATALAGRGARVVAADLRPSRVGLIAKNTEQLGLGDRLLAVVADGRRAPWRSAWADAVLVDAPCSGLGVLRRRPDARWRVRPQDVEELATLQTELVLAAAEAVAPGGQLVYSVCTLTRAETVGVAAAVAAATGLVPEPLGNERWRPWGAEGDAVGGGLLLPQDHDTDGMALFRWRRPR